MVLIRLDELCVDRGKVFHLQDRRFPLPQGKSTILLKGGRTKLIIVSLQKLIEHLSSGYRKSVSRVLSSHYILILTISLSLTIDVVLVDDVVPFVVVVVVNVELVVVVVVLSFSISTFGGFWLLLCL